jgi:hypothetical protein
MREEQRTFLRLPFNDPILKPVEVVMSYLIALLLLLPPPERSPVKPYMDQNVTCPKDIKLCLGVRVFIATGQNKRPLRSPIWVRSCMDAANDLFRPMSVAFELAEVVFLPGKFSHVRNRSERDRLGHKRWKKGYIHWFAMGRVDNVDSPGEIYGVHWRDRKITSHRWVILSHLAPPHTLPHELGHFFGLKHTNRKGSIMNLSGNDPSPMSTRRFMTSERQAMRKQLDAKLKRKELKDSR